MTRIRIEKIEKISACPETLFKVLKDYEHYDYWHPNVLKSEKNGSDTSFILKTNEGDHLILKGERIPYQKISHIYEKNPYIAETGETFRIGTDCKDTTVTFYAISKDGNSEQCLNEAEIKLKSLKHYAEYIEKGGNPQNYSKIQFI
jgi:hypothetical protein